MNELECAENRKGSGKKRDYLGNGAEGRKSHARSVWREMLNVQAEN
ncbi:hypothetical protein [Domibacillus indicus]|nr:hypothetical protein [Domibacillus indicus]